MQFIYIINCFIVGDSSIW